MKRAASNFVQKFALGQLESPVLSLAGWRTKLAGQADTYYDRNNYSGLNLIFFGWRE